MPSLCGTAPQVGYSARILYQELRARRSYTGSYETVKRYVAPLREVPLQAERALLRFETPPGQQRQIDWGKRGCLSAPVPSWCMCSSSRWGSADAGSMTPVRMSGSRNFSRPMNRPLPISACSVKKSPPRPRRISRCARVSPDFRSSRGWRRSTSPPSPPWIRSRFSRWRPAISSNTARIS